MSFEAYLNKWLDETSTVSTRYYIEYILSIWKSFNLCGEDHEIFRKVDAYLRNHHNTDTADTLSDVWNYYVINVLTA